MAISEAARADLYTGLVDVIGPARTETLMSAIPLYDLDEVATKADLQVLAAELRAEMADLKSSIIKTMTTWMVAQSVVIISAVAAVAVLS